MRDKFLMFLMQISTGERPGGCELNLAATSAFAPRQGDMKRLVSSEHYTQRSSRSFDAARDQSPCVPGRSRAEAEVMPPGVGKRALAFVGVTTRGGLPVLGPGA